MKTSPIFISGPWKAGFALAPHTLSSDFIGSDTYGNALYDTVRSEIGEALYQCKYHGDMRVVLDLAAVAERFVRQYKFPVDLVVPLPPSRPRAVQPVAAIAKELAARLGIAYDSAGLAKVKETPELKSMATLPEREAALLKNK